MNVTDLTNTYLQTGFMGMFCIAVMFLAVWYFTKGRKQQTEEREKLIREQARISAVIDNNTSVINNNTEVIKMYGQSADGAREDMQRIDGRMTRQGEQLDGMGTDIKLVLDRLPRDK